jgi:probable O-glycosylation ligase (exosortase A-associated)
MRDIFFIVFLAAILGMAVRRPFLFIFAYAYVDIVAPQRLSYYLLNSVQLSLIVFSLALGGWMLADNKRDTRFDQLQLVMLLLLVYCGLTTINADFIEEAAYKWSWVWKALIFSLFLTLTLRTRLRIEVILLALVLSCSALAISGGMKTALGGGGYGSLRLLLSDNSGLFEGSIFSMAAISIIPIILWLARHGTIFTERKLVWPFAILLIFACLLIPVGTQARTGLVCAAFLAAYYLRDSQRRMLYISGIGAALLVALPLLPVAFADRMNTIGSYQADESASTRIAVWSWTWDYALEHPFGGGFDAFRQNQLRVNRVIVSGEGNSRSVRIEPYTDAGRAYHNSYFEMLGEQGFPGLALWLYLHIIGLWRMERIRRRYKRETGDNAWISPLATALQASQLVYLLGSMFVGIAFQPFMFLILAAQIGFHGYLQRRQAEARWRPITSQLGMDDDAGMQSRGPVNSAGGWGGS